MRTLTVIVLILMLLDGASALFLISDSGARAGPLLFLLVLLFAFLVGVYVQLSRKPAKRRSAVAAKHVTPIHPLVMPTTVQSRAGAASSRPPAAIDMIRDLLG